MSKRICDLTIGDVIFVLENESKKDTEKSRIIFNLEEGEELRQNIKPKRDWLIIADLYNKEQYKNSLYTQNFHLLNYLKFRVQSGLDINELFISKCYIYFKNLALILYIREIIFQEEGEILDPIFKNVRKYLEDEQDYTKINDSKVACKYRNQFFDKERVIKIEDVIL